MNPLPPTALRPPEAAETALARREAVPSPEALRSPWRIALFRRYARRYVARHFHGVRLLGSPPRLRGPALFVLNHPSWWDPLIALLLSEAWPSRRHFAPIDATQLERYRLFRRLGFYGLQRGDRRGLAEFLRTTRALLAAPDAAVWITAQGRFRDARQRPPRLEPGVGHLTRGFRGVVVPVALEYVFWDERLPEALATFGPPLESDGWVGRPGEDTARVEAALADAQDRLAAAAQTRERDRFDAILAGRVGVGGMYDLGRRLRAIVRGEPFDPAHVVGDA